MSFARKIEPQQRIREQLNLPELVEKFGMQVPLEFSKPEEAEKNQLAILANVYVFSADKLNDLVQEVIKHSYEETFSMLKRRMNYEEEL